MVNPVVQLQNTAYVQYAQVLHSMIEDLGLPPPVHADTETGFPQNEGWFFVRWGNSESAALIVPKAKRGMRSLHSHLDLSGHDGFIPLPAKNGRVVCHFESDLSKVRKVLHLFVSASKRAIAPPVRRLSAVSLPASVSRPVSGQDATAASQAPIAQPVTTSPDYSEDGQTALARPEPAHASEEIHALSQRLQEAYGRRKRLLDAGVATDAVDQSAPRDSPALLVPGYRGSPPASQSGAMYALPPRNTTWARKWVQNTPTELDDGVLPWSRYDGLISTPVPSPLLV
jgi:hypothetical protein